jgi:hypothetical protein
MSAPDRIMAYNELRNGYTFTAFGPQPHFGPVEYVRADLFADLEAEKAKAEALLKEAVEALTWYGEQARLARLIHSEGDAGRHAIANDGGQRARATLAKIKEAKDNG